jgi:hypothetical protein
MEDTGENTDSETSQALILKELIDIACTMLIAYSTYNRPDTAKLLADHFSDTSAAVFHIQGKSACNSPATLRPIQETISTPPRPLYGPYSSRTLPPTGFLPTCRKLGGLA